MMRLFCTVTAPHLGSKNRKNNTNDVIMCSFLRFIKPNCGWLRMSVEMCLVVVFSIMQWHSVQCVSKCARLVCSRAPQTARQASGCSAFIPGGAASFFLLNHPQQVDKSSGLEDRRKYTSRGRQPERIAKAGAVHRGGNFAVAAYLIYFFFFPLQDL